MIKKDKILHFIVGFILGFGFTTFMPYWVAGFLGSIIGVGKELKDSKFDNIDLFATALGSFVGAVLNEFVFKAKFK